MSTMSYAAAVVAGAVLLVGKPAVANPTFSDPEQVDEVEGAEWKASAQAGVLMTTGNSKTTTLSAGARGSRVEGKNKLALEAGLAYARSSIFLASDTNGDGFIQASEIERPAQTTTEAWLLKARYDRFFTAHNAVYALGSVGADEPAGKELVGGGQVGYSRQLYKTKAHEVVVEAGYDYTYEKPVDGGGVSIHSLRAFAGYEGAVTAETAVTASVDSLFNVNELTVGDRDVAAFEDVRLTGKLGLTTKLFEDISFRFGFTAKFDHAPAARPKFSLPYADGFVPLADELDTITEAALIVNFL